MPPPPPSQPLIGPLRARTKLTSLGIIGVNVQTSASESEGSISWKVMSETPILIVALVARANPEEPLIVTRTGLN